MKTFEEKIIWITGASSGFGEAMAYAFAKQGAKLILSARREKELQRVKSKIEHAVIIPIDLSLRENFKEKIAEVLNVYGHIDIVIHNGGIAQNASAIDTTSEVQRKIMDIDFFSYTELTQYLLPHFIERQSGHIVVISGVLAKIGMPNRTSYCAAKAALHGYFDSLRTEVAAQNINITLLVPSFLNTSLTTKALNAQGEISNKTADNSGCLVEKAAEQAVKAVGQNKYQSFIGNKDKGWLLLLISRLFPSVAINMIIKQTKK